MAQQQDLLNILVDVRTEPAAREQLEAMPGLRIIDMFSDDESEEFPRELPAELLTEVDVLFCTFPPSNHEAMANLKLVQVGSAGYEQLLGLELPARGVQACNSTGLFDPPIAEWNVSMMINLKRNLRQMIRNQDNGAWDRSGEFQQEIRGSVVGFWGYGPLARQTARLCCAMGMTVHALTRDGAHAKPDQYRIADSGDAEGVLPDRVFVADQREEFLKGLDFLILTLPLDASTEGIVGAAELQLLPDHAFLLNPARGPLVEEAALLEALRQGWIAGAALDTHYYYPMPPDHPLWHFPNVIMTPHISGSESGPYYLPRVWDIFLGNLRRYRAGDTLLNELTAAQLSAEA
ncbi:MAG: D-2-hydroxyacid dehydrogenase [Lentisphaeria bacterium]|jgi:phosphoglycerate dehydrogenase-like enzyme|nr:D-2-hydroxyacid dehydrogenase [Lentisphaeria bacterium]